MLAVDGSHRYTILMTILIRKHRPS